MIPRNVLDATTLLLQEEGTGITWPETTRLKWINEGLKALVRYVPNLFKKQATHACTASARQVVTFPRCVKVLGVVRIEDGAIVTKADKDTLDAFMPGWVTGTAGGAVHWLPDADPKSFWTYPPAAANQALVTDYIEAPADVAENADMPVPDTFLPVITDYVMYRCYLKDAESAGNAKLAGAHFTAFESALKE